MGATRSGRSAHRAVQQGADPASCSLKSWSPLHVVFTCCKINVLCYRETERVSHQPDQSRAASANRSLHAWQGRSEERDRTGLCLPKTFSSVKNLPGLRTLNKPRLTQTCIPRSALRICRITEFCYSGSDSFLTLCRLLKTARAFSEQRTTHKNAQGVQCLQDRRLRPSSPWLKGTP